MPQHLEITMQRTHQALTAKAERQALTFWPTCYTVRLLSLKHTEWLCRANFMLDQVYTAINILKPFGMSDLTAVFIFCHVPTHLLITHWFCLGLYWAIQSLLSSQHEWTASLETGRSTPVPSEWWARLRSKYHYEIKPSSIRVHYMLIILDWILWERMERFGPNALMWPEAHLNVQIRHFGDCWMKEELRMTKPSWCSELRGLLWLQQQRGSDKCWCLYSQNREKGLQQPCMAQIQASCLQLCFSPSLFISQLFSLSHAWKGYFPKRCWGHTTLITPKFLKGKWRFFPWVSLSNLLFLLLFCIHQLLPLIKVLFFLFAPNIFGCPVC